MIRIVTRYQAVCDGCGKEFDRVYENKSQALKFATRIYGWCRYNGRLYCTDCYEYNEETDEYKLKKKED